MVNVTEIIERAREYQKNKKHNNGDRGLRYACQVGRRNARASQRRQ